MKILIDVDALFGFFNENDAHYHTVHSVIYTLAERNTQTFLLPTTLGEFATLGTIRLGRKITQEAIEAIQHFGLIHFDMTEKLTQEAIALYLKQTSKEESLFDCYVMIAAKNIKADAIFSFDKGYQKNGFKLVSDIV